MEESRGPFGSAQGRLFDFACSSLREEYAALRMTNGLKNDFWGLRFPVFTLELRQ